MKRQPLTAERLKALFRYNDDGTLTIIGGGRGRPDGKVIGAECTKNRYHRANVDGRQYPVQVIVWVMHHGKMPVGIIDHEDGDKKNNRIGNLRDATWQQNNRNRALASNNKAGAKGVHWDDQCQKWRAVVYVDRKRAFDRRFDTIFDAVIEVRRAREAIHGEHARHF